MIGLLQRRDRLEGGEDKRLGIFTVGILALAVSVLGIDIVVTARTMQGDEHGYPIRLIIPESLVEIVQRPPPVLLGENVALVSAALADRAEAEEAGLPLRNSGPSDFDRAFAIGFTAPTRRLSAPVPQPGSNGMIDLSFDLQGGAQSPNTISVSKPVAIGGTDSGRLAIRIDGAAQIFADRWQVAAMIDDTDSATANRIRTASGDDYLSFRRLRDLGVDIRYDPAGDRIIIPNQG